MKSWLEQLKPTNECDMAQRGLFRQLLLQQVMPSNKMFLNNDIPASSDKSTDTLPPELHARLAELSLLYGVPFAYLIPNEEMLPPESIRFFQLDEDWVFSLLDGALSPGRALELDMDFDRAIISDIFASTITQNHNVRRVLQGKSPEAPTQENINCSGFIMRSAIVRDWRGVEFTPYADNEKKQQLTILRLETLGPDILFGLFSGVVERLEIRQPPEGLHFGVSTEEKGGYSKTLRDTQSGHLTDKYILLDVTNSERVLDFSAIAQAITQQNGEEISSAGLALQMIQNPYTAIIEQTNGK